VQPVKLTLIGKKGNLGGQEDAKKIAGPASCETSRMQADGIWADVIPASNYQ